jgi:hypothetical protein
MTFQHVARVLAGSLALMFGAVQAQPIELVLPRTEGVPWRGLVIGSQTGAAGGHMPYFAPNLIGLLVVVAVHAAVTEGARSAETKAVQDLADKVLEPVSESLTQWKSDALWREVANTLRSERVRLVPADTQADRQAWRIQVEPNYFVANGFGAVVLDVAVSVWAPGVASDAAVKHVVRVVSRDTPVGFAPPAKPAVASASSETAAAPSATPAAEGSAPSATVEATALPASSATQAPPASPDTSLPWRENGAASLKREASMMLAHAVTLVLRHGAKQSEHPELSHRYVFAGARQIERGQLLHQTCGRVVILTLRGHMLSAPRPEPEGCEESYRF